MSWNCKLGVHLKLTRRAVHGSGRIGFGIDLQPTRLNRVNGKWTRGRPNVRVIPGGSGGRLSGSGPSVYFESELKHKMKIEIKTQRTKRSQNPENKEITTQIT